MTYPAPAHILDAVRSEDGGKWSLCDQIVDHALPPSYWLTRADEPGTKLHEPCRACADAALAVLERAR